MSDRSFISTKRNMGEPEQVDPVPTVDEGYGGKQMDPAAADPAGAAIEHERKLSQSSGQKRPSEEGVPVEPNPHLDRPEADLLKPDQ